MQSIPEAVESVTMGEVSLPRLEDGTINLQELIRRVGRIMEGMGVDHLPEDQAAPWPGP